MYEAAAAASNTINAVASAAADTINEIKESVESAASDAASDAERENISMHPSTNDEFDEFGDEFDDFDEFGDEFDDFDEFGEEPEATEPDNNPQSVVIEFTTHDDTQATKYDFSKVPNLSFYP